MFPEKPPVRRIVRCDHSATHETQGAFDHLRCPRSQTDAPFLARIEVACEEAFDVLGVMREGEQVSPDGFRMLDVKVRTIFETTEPMEQAFIPVAGSGHLDGCHPCTIDDTRGGATRSFGQRWPVRPGHHQRSSTSARGMDSGNPQIEVRCFSSVASGDGFGNIGFGGALRPSQVASSDIIRTKLANGERRLLGPAWARPS